MPDLAALRAGLSDRYEILRELGAGGMATVYLARDLKLQRRVALKVLRPELAQSLGPERFLREIEIAAQLHHPHILALHDSGESDGFLYYVMPYVEGDSLRVRLEQDGSLPIADAARLLREIADALAFAHKHGVVHRDIKPDNVMLAGRHAVVMDFGIAKALASSQRPEHREDARDPSIRVTTVGMALGTPTYMAPEQAAADPHVDHRADIYAFGVTAYEMLVGRTPFIGNTPQEVLAAHVTREPEPIRKFRETIPEPFADLVMKCLAKRPEDRWQSADEMLPLLETLAATSGSTSPTTVTSTGPREHGPWGTRIAVTAVILVAAGLAFARFTASGMSGTLIGDKALAADDLVLVSEFTNETSDSTLGATVTDAIRTELGLSNVVRVMSQTEMWDALRRMELPRGTVLSDTTLQQLAEREGAEAYVIGAVRHLGNGYQLTAQVIDASDGHNLKAARVTASNDDELIAAVEKLGKTLRSDIGESLRSVRGTPPLARVTTASLPALRTYVSARREAQEGSLASAIDQLQGAVALDTAFAAAWMSLSRLYYNANRPVDAKHAVGRAWQFRDRLDEMDALAITAIHYRVLNDPGPAEAAYRQMESREPGSAAISYSDFLLAQRRFADAERMARAAMTHKPDQGVAYFNAVEAQAAQREWPAVDSTLARMRDSVRNPGYILLTTLRALIARRDFDAARAMVPQETDPRFRAGWTCALDRYQGRITSRAKDCDVSWLRLRVLDDTAAVLAMTLDSMTPNSRQMASSIRLLAESGQVDRAKRYLALWRERFGEDDPDYQVDIHGVNGAMAMAEGDYRRAIDEYLAWHAAPFMGGSHNFNRGLPEAAQAYERLGKPDSALALLEEAMATPSIAADAVVSYDPHWYVPALREMGELYEARGDTIKAIDSYQRFVAAWQSADPELQPQIKQARARIAALAGEGTE